MTTSLTKTFAASALVLLLAAPAVVSASPQFGGGMSSDGMGRMDSPEQKSMAAYSRG